MSEKANSGPEHTVRNPGIERIATVAVDTAPFSVSVAGKDLFQASSKVFASVLIRELILRLPLLSALMAVFVVGLAFFGDMDERRL